MPAKTCLTMTSHNLSDWSFPDMAGTSTRGTQGLDSVMPLLRVVSSYLGTRNFETYYWNICFFIEDMWTPQKLSSVSKMLHFALLCSFNIANRQQQQNKKTKTKSVRLYSWKLSCSPNEKGKVTEARVPTCNFGTSPSAHFGSANKTPHVGTKGTNVVGGGVEVGEWPGKPFQVVMKQIR